MNKTLWKSMKAGMLSVSGDIGPWKIRKWRHHPGKVEMCESGFHASVRAVDAMYYVSCEVLALVEVKGEHLEQDDKQVWQSMRVLRAYEWTKRDSVALAIYAAELCLKNYEDAYPEDKRPRQAIEAAKAWLDNPCEETESAAWSAAESAAWSAARSAAWSAASAAWSAAWSARSAAESAARSAASAAWSEKNRDLIEAWIQARIKTLAVVKWA